MGTPIELVRCPWVMLFLDLYTLRDRIDRQDCGWMLSGAMNGLQVVIVGDVPWCTVGPASQAKEESGVGVGVWGGGTWELS